MRNSGVQLAQLGAGIILFVKLVGYLSVGICGYLDPEAVGFRLIGYVLGHLAGRSSPNAWLAKVVHPVIDS